MELQEAYTDEGVACNSGMLDSLPTEQAKEKIITWLENKGLGKRRVNYKLRDWVFSRQRYWGEPFPLLHELGDDGTPTGAIRPLTLADLPLQLPEMADFNPSGKPEGLLGKAASWVEVTLDGKRYRRETNTMPQWAGSCWYYLRYHRPAATTRRFAIRRKPATGCRWTYTSAVRSMRYCICSIRDSGTKSYMIEDTSRRRSRSTDSSTRG